MNDLLSLAFCARDLYLSHKCDRPLRYCALCILTIFREVVQNSESFELLL